MTDTFASIFARREALYAQVPVDPTCRDCPYHALCHSGCPLSREEGRSVDCAVKQTVYARLAGEGIDIHQFFAAEGQSTHAARRQASGYQTPLVAARPRFQPGVRLRAERLHYRDLSGQQRTLLMQPAAARLLGDLLRDPTCTVGEALTRFARQHPREHEVQPQVAALAWLKELYDRGILRFLPDVPV